MRRRMRFGRPAVAGRTATPMLGIAAVAFLPAVAGAPAIRAAALPYVALLVYSFNFIFLIVFGIWGFRLGSGGRDDGNGGGGPKRPDVEPPPPAGGRELTDDFGAWEEQFAAPGDDHAGDDRQDKVPADTP